MGPNIGSIANGPLKLVPFGPSGVVVVWFGVLGPVVVGADPIGGPAAAVALPPKSLALLSLLVLAEGQTVPTTTLVDELWGENPPQHAVRSIQQHVYRLRSKLRAASGADRVESRPLGYALATGAGELDARQFRVLAAGATARRAAGDVTAAAALAAAALGLWRGPALHDVHTPLIDRVHRPALAEHRLAMQELKIDTALVLGRPAEVIPRIRALVAEHPLREGLVRQLMTALTATGRRDAAIEEYERLCARLLASAGTEPGAELQAIHRSLLGRSPPLARIEVEHRPAELPPVATAVVGRDALTAALGDVLAGGPAPVVAVTGPTGSGSTTIAVHVAHRMRDRYPGGQLYLALRDGARSPMAAEVVRRRVRDALQRTRAHRPALLLLDGADTAAQIRPLLPVDVAVVVTSATRLTGLDVDARIELPPLAEPDALALFIAAAGPGRVDAADPAVAEILRHCGGLPIALRIAGARLAAKGHRSAGELARQLADPWRRLDTLRAGDLDVRAGLQRAYAAAPARQRQMLRLLSDGGPLVAAHRAAALAGVPIAEATELLDGLTERYLLEALLPSRRYRLPVLVRDLAAELGATGRDECTSL